LYLLHSLVDDHSRLAYSEILADERADTVAAFYQRAAAYFADHGIEHPPADCHQPDGRVHLVR
jgi:hypothetical protein